MYRPSRYTCVRSSPSIRSRVLYAALALFACLIAFGSAADAATFTVTTTSDTGAGSLRAAVAAAAASAGADTINFAIPAASCDAVTGRCTITLASEIVMDATGGALTINGTGAHLLTIDAGPGTNRIFYSFSGATLTLTGMTLTGGNGVGAPGSFLISEERSICGPARLCSTGCTSLGTRRPSVAAFTSSRESATRYSIRPSPPTRPEIAGRS